MGEDIITTGGKERIEPTCALYKNAFQDDPVITYCLCGLPAEARRGYLLDYFKGLLTAAGMNDALFLETDNYSSAAVVMPPEKRVDNPWTLIPAGLVGMVLRLGLKGGYRMLGEYQPLADSMKAKGLKGAKRYYYVFFLATNKMARGKGLSSALLRRVQAIARSEGLPVWLEATTEYSWKLYSHLGFETVDQVTLGKNVASSEGLQQQGGEGVPVWGMVWFPDRNS
ncbi:hypothetical protein KC332_g4323 [Hortaea werneckii]|uniref:N-acetyltransferase domain-containing protein n=2 Tax=Hortaea werneckii TaxID=91943 RepID=A0A3M7IL98_HORWE|nr:hypothetical protein KC358_g6007 [Hortaea werneckii]OTA34419.1 hypothetical protein BTJ68_04848 [Hortaea werneckii EXF-2000]KAI6840532.1 hypothetical protein KC350_g5432 [Hortaea werneckii]KAI6933477.1 hypothetical protein KC348_g6739 [Hortaea werneckii]KAI6940517.1 hypothetical protein KC341_g3483 [Hortaea werneckii]